MPDVKERFAGGGVETTPSTAGRARRQGQEDRRQHRRDRGEGEDQGGLSRCRARTNLLPGGEDEGAETSRHENPLPEGFLVRAVLHRGRARASSGCRTTTAWATMHRMGPALFPTLVGVLLAGLGLIIALRAFAIDGPPVPRFHARPIVISLVAIALFGVALAHLGLIAAIAVLVLVGARRVAREPAAGDRRARRGADRVFGRRVRLAARPADPALAGGLSRWKRSAISPSVSASR